MALIGLYVGVIPVAIGMLWLPWVRGVDPRWMRFLLAFTVGLLAFLGVDALLEGSEIAGSGGEAFGGAALVWLGAAVAYLALAGVDGWLRARREPAKRDGGGIGPRVPRGVPGGARHRPAQPRRGARDRLRLRDRLAGARRRAGRGLRPPQHHRGPGDRGSLSRATAAQEFRGWRCSALLAGAPAILGAWIGASAFDPRLAALMFGLGAGAIAQVIVQIAPGVRDDDGRFLHPLAAGGLLAGVAVMYVTGLLVAV